MRALQNLFIILLLVGLLYDARASARLELVRCTHPPQIDGVVDDPCWEKTAEIGDLFLLNTQERVKGTRFRLCFDNQYLYVAITADNEQMPLLRPRAKSDGGDVFHDESVEIFLGFGRRYRHLALNYVNRRYSGLNNVMSSFGWLSAVRRNDNGWTAEIAVPLYPFKQGDKLPGLSFNLLRTKQMAILDAAGVPEKFSNSHHSYIHLNNPHDPDRFVELGNLSGLRPEPVFLPQISRAEVGRYVTEDGASFYPLHLAFEPGSVSKGSARITVEEASPSAAVKKTELNAELEHDSRLTLKVPVTDFSPRTVTVFISDPVSNLCFAKTQVQDCSPLTVVEPPKVDRNYYTDEEVVRLRLRFNLPEEQLRSCSIRAFLKGQLQLEKESPQLVETLSLPVELFAMYDNQLEIVVLQDGRTLQRQEVLVRRLPPNPGCEVKIDQFNLVMLKNGKPFFPFSRLVLRARGDDEQLVSHGRASGFNTLERCEYLKDQQHDVEDLKKWLATAARHGIHTINKSMASSHHYIMGEYREKHPIEKAFHSKDPDEKETAASLLRENFAKMRPSLEEQCEVLRQDPLFLMHMIADEPDFGEVRMFTASLVGQVVREKDPYHPTVAIFARNIPDQRELAKGLFDLYGYDVYSSPGCGGLYNQPGSAMAYYTWLLKKEADTDGKVAYMMPILGGIGGGKANNQTPEEMKCIVYAALIYGAKGILYFGQYLEVPPVHWEATRGIADELEILAPAILAPELEQNIVYRQSFNPEKAVFPPVNAKLFRHPDGRLFLLAVNLLPQTYQTSIEIAGLEALKRVFSEDPLRKTGQSTFSERFLPYESKVYDVEIKTSALSPSLVVDSKPETSGPVETVEDISAIIRNTQQNGKNFVFNPTFRLTRGRGLFPTYWHPRMSWMFNIGEPESGWFLDPENLWNGIPSLRVTRKIGRLEYWNVSASDGKVFLPPFEGKRKYTVSIYAKSAEDGQRLRLFCEQNAAVFNLTTDWRRYQAVWELSYNRYGNPLYVYAMDKEISLWINALQVEEGELATEFIDDSIRAASDLERKSKK